VHQFEIAVDAADIGCEGRYPNSCTRDDRSRHAQRILQQILAFIAEPSTGICEDNLSTEDFRTLVSRRIQMGSPPAAPPFAGVTGFFD